MIHVKILGSGCSNCKKLEAVARAAADSAGVSAEFIKSTTAATAQRSGQGRWLRTMTRGALTDRRRRSSFQRMGR